MQTYQRSPPKNDEKKWTYISFIPLEYFTSAKTLEVAIKVGAEVYLDGTGPGKRTVSEVMPPENGWIRFRTGGEEWYAAKLALDNEGNKSVEIYRLEIEETGKNTEEAKKMESGSLELNYTYHVPGGKNYSIKVSGDSKGYIRKALDELAEKAPEHLEFIAAYLKGIDVSPNNLGAFYGETQTFQECQKSYDSSKDKIYRLAGAIAHEAYHGYNQARGLYQGQEGEEPTNNELTAIKYQIRVLEKIGAPRSYISRLEKQNGRHWDEDGNGIFDARDTELRRKKLN